LCRTFGFPDALLDYLAGCLRGHTAEVSRCRFDNHHVPQLRLRIDLACVFEGYLGIRFLDVLDDLFLGEDRDLAGLRVDLCFDLLGGRGVDRLR
jgi:hypothetical protein